MTQTRDWANFLQVLLSSNYNAWISFHKQTDLVNLSITAKKTLQLLYRKAIKYSDILHTVGSTHQLTERC